MLQRWPCCYDRVLRRVWYSQTLYLQHLNIVNNVNLLICTILESINYSSAKLDEKVYWKNWYNFFLNQHVLYNTWGFVIYKLCYNFFLWEFSFNVKLGLEMASSCCGHQSKLLKADKQTRGLGFSSPFHNLKQRWVAAADCKRPTLRVGSAGFMYVMTRNLVLSKHRWQVRCSLRDEVWKALTMGHFFSRIFDNSRESSG